MSVALSIAFTGLCALVADGNGTPGEILLVDAKGIGEIGGVSLPAHAPTLVVSLSALANPDSSGPTRVIVAPGSGTGRPVGPHGNRGPGPGPGGEATGLQLFEAEKDETSWPEPPVHANDPASWRDLRYVPDMRAISGDGRIDPALLEEDASAPGRLPLPWRPGSTSMPGLSRPASRARR